MSNMCANEFAVQHMRDKCHTCMSPHQISTTGLPVAQKCLTHGQKAAGFGVLENRKPLKEVICKLSTSEERASMLQILGATAQLATDQFAVCWWFISVILVGESLLVLSSCSNIYIYIYVYTLTADNYL